MAILSYRDLDVWNTAMDIAEMCYEVTRVFPADERFGLTAQIRRAAVSVASSVAEGHGSRLRERYEYHLAIARGSLMELETQVLLAERLGYVGDAAPLLGLCERTSRMLSALRRRLE
jgi:four helix bundle protein